MKNLIFLLIPLLLFWGCASAPETTDPAAEMPETVVETSSAETAPEPEEPKMIDINIPHVQKQTRFFRDGSVDTWMEYTYDEGTDVLVSRKHFDADGTVSAEYVYENSNGKAVRRNDLTDEGDLSGYELYEYDSAGNMIRKAAYDAEENLQIVSEYVFDGDGNRVKLSILDGSNGLLSYINYTFENGLEVLSELFGADGKMTNSFEKEYDAEGNLIRETDFSAEGEVEGVVVRLFEDGFCVAEEHQNRAGGLVRKYLFENDENGSPVKITLQNNKGIVLELQEKSYFYTTETVPAE